MYVGVHWVGSVDHGVYVRAFCIRKYSVSLCVHMYVLVMAYVVVCCAVVHAPVYLYVTQAYFGPIECEGLIQH